ncbi:MAG: inositol monophosphatase [Dehalococcoidia bacterium]|nr:inositol monophosphatase [Dehalococcoidia bacterium]MDW8009423.1 inositol monophosphatase family protein [Chloroflexota bacterium]
MAVQLPLATSGRTALEVARECARVAGRILSERFGPRQQVTAKGRRDFVTEADVLAERETLRLLSAEFPDHAVLSEETANSTAAGDGWTWVVDPLDGTHNFSRGIPHFCYSIALCRDGRPLLALTYAPLLGEEFLAVAGQGCSLNGQRASVSRAGSVSQSLIGIDLGYDDLRAAHLLDTMRSLWPDMMGFRLMGSAALGLAYAACGRFDLYVHHNLKPWDVAAGILLVEEAGGLILDRDGGPARLDSQGVIAGAEGAVRDLLQRAGGRPWRE